MIEPKDLKVGDILLLKDKSNNFFRHAFVVTHVDKNENSYKVIHWRGVGEPYGITETTLPSAESLSERNVEIEYFRLNDEEQAKKATKILQQWLTWAVPYDKERFAKAESSISQFFSITSDLMNHVSPKITGENFSEKLEAHRQSMEELFIVNYMDVVKYAARRDISPVRPKPGIEKQTGFHCLQGILLAFQISYAQAFVNSVPNQWLSNKYVTTNANLSSDKPRFESAKLALQADFNQQKFLSAFPLAFRLHAKLCSIDTFRHAMLSNKETITCFGTLSPLKQAEITPDSETMAKSCLFFKNQGSENRSKLLTTVVIPSIKNTM